MLRVLIVDDEPLARTRLARLLHPLAEAGTVALVGEAGDGVEALALLQQQAVDLMLLDIQMPGLDGFDLLERIPPDHHPSIVFTTAYDQYALRAFEANAVDYLLKPVTRERLEDAIARVIRLRQAPEMRRLLEERLARLLDWLDDDATASHPPRPAPTTAPAEYMRQISIPVRDRVLVVPAERLVSAEVVDGITRVYVLEDPVPGQKPHLKSHIVQHSLDQLDTSLDPNQFLRVHRAALVQFNHIQELVPWFSGRYKLLLTGEHTVIASRERSKLLKERLLL
jgi:two-component system LytT family response regulator